MQNIQAKMNRERWEQGHISTHAPRGAASMCLVSNTGVIADTNIPAAVGNASNAVYMMHSHNIRADHRSSTSWFGLAPGPAASGWGRGGWGCSGLRLGIKVGEGGSSFILREVCNITQQQTTLQQLGSLVSLHGTAPSSTNMAVSAWINQHGCCNCTAPMHAQHSWFQAGLYML